MLAAAVAKGGKGLSHLLNVVGGVGLQHRPLPEIAAQDADLVVAAGDVFHLARVTPTETTQPHGERIDDS